VAHIGDVIPEKLSRMQPHIDRQARERAWNETHPGAVPGMAMEPNMRSRLLSSSDSVPDSSPMPTAANAPAPRPSGDDDCDTVASLSLPSPPPPRRLPPPNNNTPSSVIVRAPSVCLAAVFDPRSIEGDPSRALLFARRAPHRPSQKRHANNSRPLP